MQLNVIYNKNCLDMLEDVDVSSVDLVFTSPPYNVGKEYEREIDKEYHWRLLTESSELIYKVLKPTGCYLLNIRDYIEPDGSRSLHLFDLVLYLTRNIGFKYIETYIWHKGKGLPRKSKFRAWDTFEYIFWFSKTMDFTFNYDKVRVPYKDISVQRYKYGVIDRWNRRNGNEYNDKKEVFIHPDGALSSNILFIGSESTNQFHTAVFPVKLAKWAINAATKPGDVVLDCFMGSGSTAVACIETGRNYIGYEKEKEYFDFANKRTLLARPSFL